MPNLVSHNQFFFNLGNADRMTLDASKPLHDVYVSATPEQQKDLFSRAVFNYTLGHMGFAEDDAKGIKYQAVAPRSTPIPWFNKHSDTSKKQTALQENESTNYVIGVMSEELNYDALPTL